MAKPTTGLALLLGAMLTLAAPFHPSAAIADARTLPDDSIYHLDNNWQDQHNHPLVLSDLSGRPRLLSFIYTYCQHTCPTIVAELKAITDGLSTEARDALQVTLVSLDPERDTPEQMRHWMAEQHLDERDWLMLHGEPEEVRAFAAILGVRYRPMGTDDIAHSNMVTLLDSSGVVRYQSKGLGENPSEIIKAVESLLANEPNE